MLDYLFRRSISSSGDYCLTLILSISSFLFFFILFIMFSNYWVTVLLRALCLEMHKLLTKLLDIFFICNVLDFWNSTDLLSSLLFISKNLFGRCSRFSIGGVMASYIISFGWILLTGKFLAYLPDPLE